MSANDDILTTFESALDGVNTEWTETTVSEFQETLPKVVDQPVVGTPLPHETLSLDDAAVPVELDPTPNALVAATTGVTPASLGVAERGSLLIESNPEGDEPVSLYPERHVAVVATSDLVRSVGDALDWLADAFAAGRTSFVFATGPSSTADMGALVEGVHGPQDVHVLLVTDL